MKSRLKYLIPLLILTGVNGCYKDYEEDFVEEEMIVKNAAIGQQLADDALDLVYRAEVKQKGNPDGASSFPGMEENCAMIQDDAAQKLLTIDFGADCTDSTGRIRSGRILVNYESVLGDTLADRTLTFDHYISDHKTIEGTVKLHDNRILFGDYIAIRTLTDLKVSFPDGTSITYNGDHDRVWTSGRGDSIPYNNRYTFRGSMNGVSSSGRAFTQDGATPFISDYYSYSLGFFARTYGVLELTKLEGYPDRKRTVNYGSDSTNYDDAITISTFRRTYGVSPE